MTSSHVLALAGYGCAALIAAEVWLLPVVIGWVRQVPHLRAVAVLALVFGWTVIGWIAAVTLALRPVPRTVPGTAPNRAGRAAAGSGPAAQAAAPRGGGLRQPGAAPPLVLPGSPSDPRRPG